MEEKKKKNYLLEKEDNFIRVKKNQKQGNFEIRLLLFDEDEIIEIAERQNVHSKKRNCLWNVFKEKVLV